MKNREEEEGEATITNDKVIKARVHIQWIWRRKRVEWRGAGITSSSVTRTTLMRLKGEIAAHSFQSDGQQWTREARRKLKSLIF